MLGKLFNIFKSEKVEVDLSVLQTDMHSHLIPGIDDGSKTVEESIELIRGLMELGYRKFITTPHIMQDTYRNTPEIIRAGLEKVRKALADQNIDAEVEAAAEYYLDEHFEDRLDKEEMLTFGDNLLLFELSFLQKPVNLEAAIFKMNTNGIKPILAHPERYPYFHSKSLDQYHDLKNMGLYYQLNLPSLTGAYSGRVKEIAQKMIEQDLIDLVGTDLHNASHLGVINRSRESKHLAMLIEKGKLINNTL